jgi:hypothetical protein
VEGIEMAVSRRIFLRAASAASFAVVIPSGIAFANQKETSKSGARDGSQVPREALQDPLAAMMKADFESQIGSPFSLRVKGRRQEVLQLLEVRDLALDTMTDAGGECFALIFTSAHSKPLPQAVYKIEHAELGAFRMLVAHNGATGRFGPNYAAIINRLY